ncbi:MAG TPA: hypothetical protein VJB02_05835 [Coxiellaceae bacterium]|nr:hypothetical protein [Coxiellaceae bacterium]
MQVSGPHQPFTEAVKQRMARYLARNYGQPRPGNPTVVNFESPIMVGVVKKSESSWQFELQKKFDITQQSEALEAVKALMTAQQPSIRKAVHNFIDYHLNWGLLTLISSAILQDAMPSGIILKENPYLYLLFAKVSEQVWEVEVKTSVRKLTKRNPLTGQWEAIAVAEFSEPPLLQCTTRFTFAFQSSDTIRLIGIHAERKVATHIQSRLGLLPGTFELSEKINALVILWLVAGLLLLGAGGLPSAWLQSIGSSLDHHDHLACWITGGILTVCGLVATCHKFFFESPMQFKGVKSMPTAIPAAPPVATPQPS